MTQIMKPNMVVVVQIVALFEDRETADRVGPLDSENPVVEEQMVVPIGKRAKAAQRDSSDLVMVVA